MKVFHLEEGQLANWTAFVSSHGNGGLFHDGQWRNVLRDAFPHLRAHYLVLKEQNADCIVAGLPLYEVRSRIFGVRLVSVPFSTWCDPLLSKPEELGILMIAARSLADTLNSRKIELRCRALPEIPSLAGWQAIRNWKLHVTRLDRDEPELWRNLSRTSVRQRVRRAEKNEVIVSVDDTRAALREFFESLVDSRRALNLPVIPYCYFAALHERLPRGAIRLLVARRRGATLGSVLALTSGRTFHLEFAADAGSAGEFGAMQLLYWRAMQMARADGFREFSFGRTDPGNTGLMAYKRHWNTQEEDLISLVWNRREKMRPRERGRTSKLLLKSARTLMPRFIYKRLGSFIYNNWG